MFLPIIFCSRFLWVNLPPTSLISTCCFSLPGIYVFPLSLPWWRFKLGKTDISPSSTSRQLITLKIKSFLLSWFEWGYGELRCCFFKMKAILYQRRGRPTLSKSNKFSIMLNVIVFYLCFYLIDADLWPFSRALILLFMNFSCFFFFYVSIGEQGLGSYFSTI